MTVASVAGTVLVFGPSFSPDPFLLRDSCADSPWLHGQLWPGRRQAVVPAWQRVTRCPASFADACAAEPARVPGHGQPTAPTPRTGKSCQALSPCSVGRGGSILPGQRGGWGCLTRPGLCCPPGAEGAHGDVGQQQRHPPRTPGPAVLCQQSCLNLLGTPGGR